ncbi:hypothetical protein C356_06720 [Cryptococcus neoformans c45]|nr:hypothetical protein C356_06720 [Cryptococcus neoformans var. grubii c45]
MLTRPPEATSTSDDYRSLSLPAVSERKKRLVSCTTCRSRKIKCVKIQGTDTCAGCAETRAQCTYSQTSTRRKPYGRPYPSSSPPRGSRVSGRSESHPGQQHSSNVDDRATDSPHPFAPFVPSQQTPTAIFDPSLDSIHTPTDHAVDTLGSSLELGTWLPDAFPLSWPCDQPDGNLIGPSSLNDSNSASGTGSGSGSVHDARTYLPLVNPESREHHGQTGPGRLETIEDVMSWSTLLTFVGLYHERLYPRLPIVHWPSFSQHLVSRRDKTNVPFRAFLLSLMAYAVLQLPSSVIPDECRHLDLHALHNNCSQSSRRLRPDLYHSPELEFVCAMYCDYVYLRSLEQTVAAEITLAQAMRLATLLKCHEKVNGAEDTSTFIDAELRKRVFWLIYGSDRTTAALTDRPLLLSDYDITVQEPLEVDDGLITNAGCLPQPIDSVPIIAGFVRVTRVFRILSRTIELLRQYRNRTDLSDDPFYFSSRLTTIQQALQTELAALPPPLQIMDDFSASPIQHAFETCKANILVTQALARYEVYQLALMTGNEQYHLDDLTENVLSRLDLVPNDSLTANGSSMRHKVIFIAIFLLGKESGKNPSMVSHNALSILDKTIRDGSGRTRESCD